MQGLESQSGRSPAGHARSRSAARPKAEIRNERAFRARTLPAMSRPRQILAMGGGGFSMEAGNAPARRARARPHGRRVPARVLPPHRLGRRGPLHRALLPGVSRRPLPAVARLALPPRRRRFATSRPTCWRRTSSTSAAAASSRCSARGTRTAIDAMLRGAWESGVVMAGLSAGSLCWFEHGVTAFHGESRPVRGMGFLPYSNAVHYDDKPERRAAFLRRRSRTGWLPATAPATAPLCTSSARSWPRS